MTKTKFQFVELGEAEKRNWKNFVDSTNLSTILQYPQWGEVKRGEGWTPYCLALKVDTEIKVGAQALLKRAPMLGNYLYVPYGPLYADYEKDKEAVEYFLSQLIKFARKKNCFVVEIEPLLGDGSRLSKFNDESEYIPSPLQVYFQPEFKANLLSDGWEQAGRNMQPQYKLMYDLTESQDEIMARMKKNTRYNVRYAERQGVVVDKIGLQDPAAAKWLDKFYQMMERMQERAGGYPIRPKQSFIRLQHEFKQTAVVLFLQARFKEDVIAMNISEFTSYWSSSFYGAGNRKHAKKKAAYLLRWESVMEAKRRGCKVYDFWGFIPYSDQHKGYSDNKLSFGGFAFATEGIFAYPLDSFKYTLWNNLLPVRSRLAALFRKLK